MTEKQQRFAIAEACGWKNADHPDVMQFKQGWTMPEKWCMDPKGVLRFNHDRPDYLNDLNAMHKAEKTLNQNLAAEYARMLTSIAWQSEQPTFSPITATAAQRAEAFLCTIEKWTTLTKPEPK
jgi:hypothetical protein